jgi:molecular chaperone DnaJ
MLKDYYKILELPPNAGLVDIKKSFRRLAMRYHPDKHGEDELASAQFMEVQEAYDVLTDPEKKETYLQQRWYEQSVGRKLSGAMPLTSVAILQDAIRLNKYVSGLDPFRIDKDGLLQYQLQMLSPDAITILKTEGNQEIINEIVRMLLDNSKSFRLLQAALLAGKLQELIVKDSKEEKQLEIFIAKRSQDDFWQKWKIPAFIIITMLLCYLIYKSAN